MQNQRKILQNLDFRLSNLVKLTMFNLNHIIDTISDFFGKITKISDIENPIIVGYSSIDQADVGLFYCPYIPLQISTPLVDDIKPVKLQTRYNIRVYNDKKCKNKN